VAAVGLHCRSSAKASDVGAGSALPIDGTKGGGGMVSMMLPASGGVDIDMVAVPATLGTSVSARAVATNTRGVSRFRAVLARRKRGAIAFRVECWPHCLQQ
jgi:hypothetical protein